MRYQIMWLDFRIALLLLLTIGAVRAKTTYESIMENEQLADKLKLLEPETLLRNYKYGPGDIDSTANPSCAQDLVLYRQAIDRREAWALKMLDASSRVPAGLLHGHVVDLGMFDECLETQGKSTTIEIRGRHCMYSINPTFTDNYIFPFNPTMSICLPDSCTNSDLVNLVNKTISVSNRLQHLGVSLANATCSTPTSNLWSWEFNLCGAVIVIYIGFLILCTLFHVLSRQFGYDFDESSKFRVLIRLSMLRNAKSVLSMKPQKGDVGAIHGIRAISITLIILAHHVLFHLLAINVNVIDLQRLLCDWRSLFPMLGVSSVDTFFTLSGFLVAYKFFQQMRIKKTFNVFLHYLHRYVRLTPAIVTMFLMNIVLLPNIATGPRFEWFSNIFSSSCKTKWWSFFLYINNFQDKDNWCMVHLWYLAADMQLFWISPFILYPLYKRPKIGLTIVASLILISASLSAAIVGFNKYSAIYLSNEPRIPIILKSFQDIYVMSYTRASPWLLGLLFGYEIVHKNIVLSKSVIYKIWIMTFGLFVFCVLGLKSFLYASYKYNPTWEIIFAALARPFWSLFICWTIYTCINDSSGLLSKILSWKFFRPLSRISYCVYLIHILLPFLEVSALRTSIYFNFYSLTHTYLSNVIISNVMGFFYCLAFEVPFLVLEEAIFKRKSLPSPETQKSK